LQAALVLTFVLALGGAFLPGTIGTVCGTACIAVLIAAPVVRVTWLVVDWIRARDLRFALLGSGLLAVLMIGGTLALIR